MPMKVKNPEWINFKENFILLMNVLGKEIEHFDIPEDYDNFELCVDGCVVHPIFIKNNQELRVQYDFTLCNTKIRLLTLSMLRDSGRIEVTLKNEEHIVIV